MLSDEMLSIKQQIYEKDTTYPPTVYIRTRGSIPTPTLELKQMWPIEKLESNNEKKYNFEQHMKNIDNTPIQSEETQVSLKPKSESNNNNSDKEKVLELRSLSGKLHKKIKTSSLLHHFTKQCTCTNFNSQTTKSHQHAHFPKNQEDSKLHFTEAFHASDPNAHSKCSRTYPVSSTTSYPFYITYSPYFVGTVADLSNIYYHPDVISDSKRPKHHKNRKHKKPTTEQVYEDDSEESFEEYDEKTTRRKDKSRSNYEFKIVYEPTEPESDRQFENHNIQTIDKDKFVENIVDDLKVYNNEAVIKDCYCSSCSFKKGLQIISIVYLLQWLA
ncbi:unnamed protein product [Colias eurytheme]|nr:unnamed protein product [Colias eurytheme]